MQVLADAYSTYADMFCGLDLDPGETPDASALAEIQQAIATVDQAEVTAAAERLSTWTTENC